MTIYDAESFNSKEYDRAVLTGTLGTMRFYGKDRNTIEALRSRVLSYSRTAKRNHILETTLLDENHIEIKYCGSLDKNK